MTGSQRDVYQPVTLTSRPRFAGVDLSSESRKVAGHRWQQSGGCGIHCALRGVWRDMRNWRLILLVLVAGGAVAYFGPGRGLWTSAAPSGARVSAPAIPVMASKAERADIPI